MRPALLLAALIASAGVSAQSQAPALAGYVLSPDWTPVPGGTVTVKSLFAERVAPIGADGRFRIDGLNAGPHDVSVSAARLIAHRLQVTLPASGLLTLPPIQLSAGSYLRTTVVTPSYQPIPWPSIIGESYDLNGVRIPVRPGEWSPARIDPNGAVTLGPLPPGMFVLALDTPPFARMRLRDVRVSGEPLIDMGAVVAQEGAVLNVEVVDAAGEPVPGHEVFLEDGVALSPLWSPPVRTDALGRATFTRLASGRYHLRTRGIAPCGGDNVPPTVGRPVDMPSRGAVDKMLVIGGMLNLRLNASGGAPMPARSVAVTPVAAEPSPPTWLRQPHRSVVFQSQVERLRDAPCRGVTDSNGRVKLPNVPPGPARIAVRLGNSILSRRLEVQGDGREVVLELPTGVLPLRVVDSATGSPVAGASITWMSAGARVESNASVTGEALLEGVSEAPGVLSVEAPGYRRRVAKLSAPPDVLQEFALARSAVPDVTCRVVTQAGEPIHGAVVELVPHDPLQTTQLATTDSGGIVRFLQPPSGPLRLTARADGYAAARLDPVPVPSPAASTHANVTLSPGYRVIVVADQALDEGPHLVRITNQQGEGVDALLDAASERTIARGSQVSLGPLPHGMYVVGFRARSGERSEKVAVRDRDVQVKFR